MTEWICCANDPPSTPHRNVCEHAPIHTGGVHRSFWSHEQSARRTLSPCMRSRSVRPDSQLLPPPLKQPHTHVDDVEPKVEVAHVLVQLGQAEVGGRLLRSIVRVVRRAYASVGARETAPRAERVDAKGEPKAGAKGGASGASATLLLAWQRPWKALGRIMPVYVACGEVGGASREEGALVRCQHASEVDHGAGGGGPCVARAAPGQT